MTISSPLLPIFPGAVPGEAAGKSGSEGALGVFAALLAALNPEQGGSPSAPGTLNAGLFAQLSLSGADLEGAGGEARPDLAAILGADVEVTVTDGTAPTVPAPVADGADPAIAVDPLLPGAETTDIPAEESASPVATAAQPPAGPEAQPAAGLAVAEPKPTGLDNAVIRTAGKPGEQGIENALTRGTHAQTAPAAGTPAPAPATAVQPETAPAPLPAAPADPLAALKEASLQPAKDPAPAVESEEAADQPELPAGTGDKRPLPTPSNRPVLVHVAPHPLTAQTLVTIQESPSADTIPLGATGGAAQTVQLKAVSAPPPPTPGATPVPLNGIAVHIAQQAQTGARRFDIRLDPPELGRIEVRLEVNREGHVHTHLVVERSETLDLLQRDARQLERALQDAGLDTSQGGMKFSLKEHGAGQQGARDEGFGNSSGTGKDSAPEPAEEPVWQGRAYTATGGLDIRI